MDDYGLVSSDPPWKWVVDKPCFVSWYSTEEGPTCLGQLSPLNSTSRLAINIGWRPGSNELLIALHLPVSIRASKHPRDMFMIIPCDFATSNIDMTFAPVQADGRVDLESAGLGDCNLFHIPFELAKACDVVMPQAKRQKPVKGTPKELMSRLKSLSETSSFDVYFRFDTFAQLELRKLFASICQLSTPSLRLDSMYDGRGGGVNLWLNQGLDLDTIEPIELENKKCESCAEPTQQDFPPPPYTFDTIPSLDSNKSRVEVPFSDASVASVSLYKDSDGEGVPETPSWVRMQRIMDYRSASVDSSMKGATLKRAASVGSLPDDYARRRKQMCLFSSPLPGPLPHNAPAPIALSRDPENPPINNTHSTLLPPATTPNDRAEAISQWLYAGWTVLPSAHRTLRPQLLAMGTAPDATALATARIEASTRLAFAAARASKQEVAIATLRHSSDAENQVKEVVEWVNGVKPDADVALMHELVILAGAAMEVVESDSDSREELMARFLMEKARCIASACVLRSFTSME